VKNIWLGAMLFFLRMKQKRIAAEEEARKMVDGEA
jgi:hypothetical protein